jgi:integrase
MELATTPDLHRTGGNKLAEAKCGVVSHARPLAPLDPYQLASRTVREAIKDKSYRAYELGQRAGEYLRWKRGMITPLTYRDYESCLDKLARAFPDLSITDFEPPIGTTRLEEWMDQQWGACAPRTYNKNRSILRDFFTFCVLKGHLHGDPSLPLQPHKERDVYRETFSEDIIQRILTEGPAEDHLLRDRLALRLLLLYGLRKGALRNIQFKHFDHVRKRLTIFSKGGKIRHVPIPEPSFWDDLGRHLIDVEAAPDDYLLNAGKSVFWKYDEQGKKLFRRFEYHERQMGEHGAHDWWYSCLERASVVLPGTKSGSKMHKARHTAGQRVLDATGNLVAAQQLLGHSDIKTTAEHYVGWDEERLRETMSDVNREYADG